MVTALRGFGVTVNSVVGGSGGDSPGSSSTTFAVTLDANGEGSFALADADTYEVSGLCFDQEQSLAYSAPLRFNKSDTDAINIRVPNFDSADEGAIVNGQYYLPS